MDNVIDFLKDYIWKNGFDRLSERPFDVYEAMVTGDKDTQAIDQRMARMVMVTLMSKTHEKARMARDARELVDYIQAEHYVTEEVAKEIAAMYRELFSDENEKAWEKAREAGFEEFCEEYWTVEWEGACDWQTEDWASYPCTAEATLDFAVEDKEALRDHLSHELKSNPFLSDLAIYWIIASQIEADLDDDMEAYCNASHYREPYWEEFVGRGTRKSTARWKSWGLDILDITGSGEMCYDL